MDTMELENPHGELKQQGSLRDVNGDSMGRTPVCTSALGWPQRCVSVPVPLTGQRFGWTVSNVLLLAIFLTEKLIIPKVLSSLSYSKNINLRI